MRPTTIRFSLAWSEEDQAIAIELRRLTGARTTAGVIRAALRAHYRSLTRRPFVRARAAAASSTGTEG